jgi:ParB/RepB/Spo0J family partition protein
MPAAVFPAAPAANESELTMTPEPILVPLAKIQHNPYQPRMSEDPAAIREIAVNIFRNGLLQIPSARAVNGHYELVFGHTRRAAFELLASQGVPEAEIAPDARFAEMPLYVHQLDDRQMFEQALAENIKRRDLNPIETATAMRIYMTSFGANSKQAAELFGVNDATVRGKLRLLDLPEEAQSRLAEGVISEATARTLLSMQKIAPHSEVIKAVKQIEKDGGRQLPDEFIESAVDHLPDVVDMWNEDRSEGKPRAGWDNMWLLDMKNFPNDLLPELTAVDIAQVLGIEDNQKALALVDRLLKYDDKNSLAALDAIEPASSQKIEHLLNPPTCTACPFYTKVRGSHYCGMKICHTRKTAAWHSYLTQQASKRFGIAIYQPSDGKYSVLDSYNDRMLFNQRSKDLRLLPAEGLGRHYQYFDGLESDVCLVVATGEALNRRRTGSGNKVHASSAERKQLQMYRQKRKELIWEATLSGKSALEGLSLGALKNLDNWFYLTQDDRPPATVEPDKNATPEIRAEYLRRIIAWKMFNRRNNSYAEGEKLGKLSAVVTRLKNRAEELDWKLPKSLTALAAKGDAEIKAVSAATAKAKARKK